MLDLGSRVHELSSQHHLNRHPNLAFFGGTVIIAIMVITAFANVANSNDCSLGKSIEANSVQALYNANKKATVEA